MWAAGSASGIGSYPGEDPLEALRVVLGELPELPHLPELPGRGPGADLVGRSAALLVDMPVQLRPSGWRITDRPGRDLRRARGMLSTDLDALDELAADHQGPLKLQVAGVWTLAAGIEAPRGERLLGDPGAVRDLAESLAEGIAAHVAEVAKRVPGAELLVQVDEPALPAVLAGTVPTASGLNRHRPVDEQFAGQLLGAVLAAAGRFPVVHCCAADVPYPLLRTAGAGALAVPLAGRTAAGLDRLAAAVDAGLGLLLGVVPGTDTELSAVTDTVDQVRRFWRDLGRPAAELPERVVVTPACGLAGASPRYARAAVTHCRAAGRMLRETE